MLLILGWLSGRKSIQAETANEASEASKAHLPGGEEAQKSPRGMFVWRCFLNQLIDVSIFEATDWSSK